MATGYKITIGYLSGYSCREDTDGAWLRLSDYAQSLSRQPKLIAEEACKFGAPKEADGYTLMDVCKTYEADYGNPLMINHDKRYILQMASAGGEMRTMKEHVRRAFCRLLIYEMHRHGIEVEMTVA